MTLYLDDSDWAIQLHTASLPTVTHVYRQVTWHLLQWYLHYFIPARLVCGEGIHCFKRRKTFGTYIYFHVYLHCLGIPSDQLSVLCNHFRSTATGLLDRFPTTEIASLHFHGLRILAHLGRWVFLYIGSLSPMIYRVVVLYLNLDKWSDYKENRFGTWF